MLPKTLLNIQVDKPANLLPLDKIDVGDSCKKILSKCTSKVKEEYLQEMQQAMITITKYLQEHIPLDIPLVHDLMCLNPLLREKSSPEQICRIARLMPHVISSDSISLLRDEWRVFKELTLAGWDGVRCGT